MNYETFDQTSKPSDRIMQMYSWAGIVLSSAIIYFCSFRFGQQVFGTGYEDDFFYYAQVARNLAFHGMSSFDGVHVTNGYHPLWFLVIALVTWMFDIGGLFHASSI